MRLLVLSKYPTPASPSSFIFIYKLVQELITLGHEVTVLSPKKLNLKNLFLRFPLEERAILFQPLYLSFSNKKIGSFDTYVLTRICLTKAVKYMLKKMKLEYDMVYCHFWDSGFIASEIFPENTIPIVLAFGDSKSYLKQTLSNYSKSEFENLLKKLSGIISVSFENRKFLLENSVLPSNILVSPNATDSNVFFPRNKAEMRQKYSINSSFRVVIFVGSFTERKGFDRVLESIRDMNSVYGIFLGSGRIKNNYGKILFHGSVGHLQVAEMLSCADLFVLPTLNEGSCNAIVEAMTCGLPIIASDIPEVNEQCEPSFSILVNPCSIKDIRSAIKSIIYNDDRLRKMSDAAIAHSKRFELHERAKNISVFLETCIKV